MTVESEIYTYNSNIKANDLKFLSNLRTELTVNLF
jgi:hypothetical protein